MLTQSSIYKEYLDLMDTEAWKKYIILKIYKLQQIFRPRIISDASKSEKLYNGEIKMYFYLAMVGFEPTPTTTAAPSNTETTVIHIYIYIYIYLQSSNCNTYTSKMLRNTQDGFL